MRRQSIFPATLSAAIVLLVSAAWSRPVDPISPAVLAAGQDQGATREFTIVGDHYAFQPPTLEVNRNDLVKIAFTARDIAHSFTIDQYRIAKRANAGQTITFEFRADRPGTFTYYCNLSQDDGCRNMKGRLVVK
jgi:heme/copper-type cytochrome/quinol oxidase subunit 2